MQKYFRASIVCLLSSLIGLSTTSAFATKQEKDPAAWYTEDATPRAQYETAKREADAAYRQALTDCRDLRGTEKTTCVKEAKATYTKDIADAKKLLSKS